MLNKYLKEGETRCVWQNVTLCPRCCLSEHHTLDHSGCLKKKKIFFCLSLLHEHLSSFPPRSRERACCKVAAASGLVSILPQVRKHHGATPAFRSTGYAELLKGICKGARRRHRLASIFCLLFYSFWPHISYLWRHPLCELVHFLKVCWRNAVKYKTSRTRLVNLVIQRHEVCWKTAARPWPKQQADSRCALLAAVLLQVVEKKSNLLFCVISHLEINNLI